MKKPPPSRHAGCTTLIAFLLAPLFLFPTHLAAQHKEATGLVLFIDAGMLMPNDKQAGFYDGRDSRPNTINRVLHSETYGNPIWQTLKDRGYITDAVGNYTVLTVDEWPHMYYKNGYQVGFGLRYLYQGGWSWLLRVDYARVTAAGAWNLSSTNGTGILSDRGRYVRCGMYGIENRIYLDLGIGKAFDIADGWSLGLETGVNFNNTKIQEQKMEIAGDYYNVLDIWDGASPSSGTGSYEYVNQGGVGFGGFATLMLSYAVPGYGSIDMGYSCYYTQTRFPEYNDDDAFALQQVIFLRANLNNFMFWN